MKREGWPETVQFVALLVLIGFLCYLSSRGVS